MKRKRTFHRTIAAAIIMAPLSGCSSGVPFGWGSGSSPFSSSPTADSPTDSGIKSSVSSAMQKLKSGVTAPFASQPKSTDPTSLSSTPLKVGPEVYTSASALYESQGNVNAAFDQYQKAMQVAPKDPNVLLGYARLNDRHGRFDEAVKTFNQVTQINSNNSTAFNDLGLCYAKQSQVGPALENLNRAAQLQPNNSLYRNNLARVLVRSNRVDDAYTQLAAVHSPAHAHYNLGFLLQEKGDNQGAQHHFTVAAQTDPNLVQARQMLSKLQGEGNGVQNQMNQYSQAGQQLLNPNNLGAGRSAQPTWPPVQPTAGPSGPTIR